MAYDEGPVSDAVLRHKGAITVQQVRQLRDNLTESQAGGVGARVNQLVGHPNDMVRYGDGATGLLYDFAVTGAVPSVTTPVFDPAFCYALIFEALNPAPTVDLNFAVERGGVFSTVTLIAGQASPQFSGRIEFHAPGVARINHILPYSAGHIPSGPTMSIMSGGAGTIGVRGASDILTRGRLAANSGNLAAGRVWLHRWRFVG